MPDKELLRIDFDAGFTLVINGLTDNQEDVGTDLIQKWKDLRDSTMSVLKDDKHRELVDQLPKLLQTLKDLKKKTVPRLRESKRRGFLGVIEGTPGFDGLEVFYRQYLDIARGE